MTTGERIKKRRLQLGMTVPETADKLGVSVATMYRYEKGEIEKLPSTALEPLARLLHTTPAWLMGWKEEDGPSYPPVGHIPLLKDISGDVPLLDEQNIEDYIPSPPFLRTDFAIRHRGHDMINARIFDGDIVYIRSCRDVNNGEIAAVLIDGQMALKRVYRMPDRLTLRAENPLVLDRVFSWAELDRVRIVGQGVCFLSPVQHEADRAGGDWRRFVGRPAAARGGGFTPMDEEQARLAWKHDQQRKRSGKDPADE